MSIHFPHQSDNPVQHKRNNANRDKLKQALTCYVVTLDSYKTRDRVVKKSVPAYPITWIRSVTLHMVTRPLIRNI